jgi:hypothetical protein
MADHKPRLFVDSAAVVRVGQGLLGGSLPKAEWTHEAHLASTTWLARERPDIALETDLPGIIRAFNESVGGVNDDTQGYHETITQCFIRAVRLHLVDRPREEALVASVNALLESERGRRDWPLRFYTASRLFSVSARCGWIAPDLAPLPEV